jgi:hypothetical protein
MGIFTPVRFQQQARGYLGVLFGEFRSDLAQKRELALVIVPQLIAHCLPP